MKYTLSLFVATLFFVANASAQNLKNNPTSNHGNKFEQLGTILPDANTYRTASGAPGHQYWQQRADYTIDATLNEKDLRIEATEQITYHNNSPDALTYLWLQLDENQHLKNGDNNNFDGSKVNQPLSDNQLDNLEYRELLGDYGVKILSVTDVAGKKLAYTINQTMMRIDLPQVLKSGQKFVFNVAWNFKIVDKPKIGGRCGYELFPEDGNHVFVISQWYPRMCVYSDYQGWNNKQFTGRGEFALTFGNFKVKMKVPADHVVASTGVCNNIAEILNVEQQARWKKSQTATTPVEIITLDEAKAREKNPDKTNYKTWSFSAENVRDFAWGSSRKFVWDAMGIKNEGKQVMCMSYYPKEAYNLYSKYSTKVIAHTIKTYSKYTIPYAYPSAISVEAAMGMEYPMISFNYGRTETDGTYTERTKHGMIEVIIHEVGHNFFPMIINSDERQSSWMDEGLNTFVQFLSEQEFDNNYPSSRGPAHKIVPYMQLPKDQLEPIMVNSENIILFGPNAYAKPATALNILRETIMGRELFDYAFKEYCKRWAYKHPTPADLFRTMEDASGVDLDWFWRAWFFDIEPVDISLDNVVAFTANNKNKHVEPVAKEAEKEKPQPLEFEHVSKIKNRESGFKFLVDIDTNLRDVYYYKRLKENLTPADRRAPMPEQLQDMSDADFEKYKNKFYYELNFTNKGGAVMPIIIQWNFTDGTSEIEKINAYIWRKNEHNVTKTFYKNKEVKSIVIDPLKETADIDETNNVWPKTGEAKLDRFDLYQAKTKEKRR
ncbi:MAG: M1 family metallopeptidase [Bacteroidota bacterium]